jgi:hypothetical protein
MTLEEIENMSAGDRFYWFALFFYENGLSDQKDDDYLLTFIDVDGDPDATGYPEYDSETGEFCYEDEDGVGN